LTRSVIPGRVKREPGISVLHIADIVMAGLVPAIHVYKTLTANQDVDARRKAGHDGDVHVK